MNATSLPRVSWRDIIDEASAGVLARPMRAALTAMGTVIGIAALIATLGISRTASNQIVGHIDDLQSLQVTVEAPQPVPGGVGLPWDVEARMGALHGVSAVGATWPAANRTVRFVDVDDPVATTRFTMDVIAVTPGVLPAVGGVLARGGRFLTSVDEARDYPVAVLGAGAARRLGVTDVSSAPAVFVGDAPLTVVGILSDVQTEPGLLNAVLVTPSTAGAGDANAPTLVIVRAARGAVSLVATQAPLALDPGRVVTGLRVREPPDPRGLRRAVQGDLDGLLLLLGTLSLLIGAIGIANVTLVTVMERTHEIGLRRALGATRAKIAVQVLLESVLLGSVGGLVGSTVGVLVTVGTAGVKHWTPVLEPLAPLAAIPCGALVGLAAGLYPALRAARMEPAEALRS